MQTVKSNALAVVAWCEVARKERVDQGVSAPPVEDEIGAQVPFAPEADALQNALRR